MTPAFKQEFITFLQQLSEEATKDEMPDDAATLLGNMLLKESLRGPLHLQVMATEKNANRLYHYLDNACWFGRKTEQERNVIRNVLRGEIIRAKLESKRALDADRDVATAFEAFFERMQTVPQSPPAQEATRSIESDKLSLWQIALLHIYIDKVIPKAADEIAQQHGHRSGAKLYEHYRKLSHRTGRTGVEGQQLAPMINDIEAVIIRLAGKARQQAESELQTLKVRK